MPLLDHEDQNGQPDHEGDPGSSHGELDDHVVPIGEVPDVAHICDVALVPKAIVTVSKLEMQQLDDESTMILLFVVGIFRVILLQLRMHFRICQNVSASDSIFE